MCDLKAKTFTILAFYKASSRTPGVGMWEENVPVVVEGHGWFALHHLVCMGFWSSGSYLGNMEQWGRPLLMTSTCRLPATQSPCLQPCWEKTPSIAQAISGCSSSIKNNAEDSACPSWGSVNSDQRKPQMLPTLHSSLASSNLDVVQRVISSPPSPSTIPCSALPTALPTVPILPSPLLPARETAQIFCFGLSKRFWSWPRIIGKAMSCGLLKVGITLAGAAWLEKNWKMQKVSWGQMDEQRNHFSFGAVDKVTSGWG